MNGLITLVARPVMPVRPPARGEADSLGPAWWWLPTWHPDVPLAVAWQVVREAHRGARWGQVPTRTSAQQQELAQHRPEVPSPEHVQALMAQRLGMGGDEPWVWEWLGMDAARVGQLASAEVWEWLALVWAEDPSQRGRVPVAWAVSRGDGRFLAAQDGRRALWTGDPREASLFASREAAQRVAGDGLQPVPMYGWWHDPPQPLFGVEPAKIDQPKPTDSTIEWRVEVRGLSLRMVPRLQEGPQRALPLWSITREMLGYSPRDQGLPVAITEQNILGVWEWDAGLFLTDLITLDDSQDVATRVLRLDAVLRAFGYRTVLRVPIDPLKLVSLP
jgi:hypothetical protein